MWQNLGNIWSSVKQAKDVYDIAHMVGADKVIIQESKKLQPIVTKGVTYTRNVADSIYKNKQIEEQKRQKAEESRMFWAGLVGLSGVSIITGVKNDPKSTTTEKAVGLLFGVGLSLLSIKILSSGE